MRREPKVNGTAARVRKTRAEDQRRKEIVETGRKFYNPAWPSYHEAVQDVVFQ